MVAGDQITADGQLEWRGTLLGTGSPYRMLQLEGWLDLGEVRIREAERPGRHGLFQGNLLLGKRIITLTFMVKDVSPEQFGAVITKLREITAPTERPVEEPLVVRLDGQAWQANARCVRRTIDVQRFYAVGHTTGAIQWYASDPRVYSPVPQEANTGLPSPPVTGLAFPLRFPLVYGTGRAGGRLIAANTGGAATWPVWEISGPVTGPMITNREEAGGRLVFDPSFTVQDKQILRIDTDARTVQIKGVNQNDKLLVREWFPIPAGGLITADFGATSYDPTALLTCRWRHATI